MAEAEPKAANKYVYILLIVFLIVYTIANLSSILTTANE